MFLWVYVICGLGGKFFLGDMGVCILFSVFKKLPPPPPPPTSSVFWSVVLFFGFHPILDWIV